MASQEKQGNENLPPNIDVVTIEERSDCEHNQIDTILASIHRLSDENKERLLDVLQAKGECVCQNDKFPHDKRPPAYEAALRYYFIAREIAEGKKEERRKKEANTQKLVKTFIMKSIKSRRRSAHKKTNQIAHEIAEKLVAIKEIKIHDIVTTIEAFKPKIQKECNVEGNILKSGQHELNELIKFLKAHQPVKPYLKKLLLDSSDLRELKLPKIWREKEVTSQNGNPEGVKANTDDLGEVANTYCSIFFNPYSLHPDVVKENDLRQLCAIVDTMVPLNVDSWQKYRSAVAKINMMHLVETIRSQIDFHEMRAASQHLEKLIRARTVHLPDMHELLTCGNPEKPQEEDSVIVDSIRVAAEKSEVAAARKYMDKGSENTKDYDAYNINDWVRFSIMLTKKDSQDPEKTKKTTVKALAIICALFGTDIPHERLRYAFETGSTNPNSTGKHQAFHLTLRYRYQCGTNKNKVRTIKVEAQIQKYMDSEDLRLDHDDYARKKDEKNTRIAGMNVTFYQFVTDVCDYILSKHSVQATADFYDNTQRPEQEKLALMVLMILTKKNKDGSLENAKIIREIFEDQHQRAKIEQLTDQYKDYIPYQRRKKGFGRESNKPTLINKLAIEVEQIFDNLDHRHSYRLPQR